MNRQIVKSYIKEYKSQFEFVHKQEIYKWQAVKQFQDNWNIDATDFYSMLEISLKLVENLLDSGQYFPKRMLLKNTEKTPEKSEHCSNIFLTKILIFSRGLNFSVLNSKH